MKSPSIEMDSANNFYVNVDNVRITLVKKENRKPESDWSGKDTIRIQAYRDGTTGNLMQGAELPIGSTRDIFRFAMALFALVENEMDWSKISDRE
jgi:hypothetical protein